MQLPKLDSCKFANSGPTLATLFCYCWYDAGSDVGLLQNANVDYTLDFGAKPHRANAGSNVGRGGQMLKTAFCQHRPYNAMFFNGNHECRK